MKNKYLNLAMINGCIYTAVSYIAYTNDMYNVTILSLLIAFPFVIFSVLFDR